MLVRGEMCDMKIQARDGAVNVHSLVLSTLSPSMRDLCYDCRQINLLGQSRETVDLLVEFAYCGHLKAAPDRDVAEKLCLLAQVVHNRHCKQ